MKVLMISGDKNLLNPECEAGKRLALQRAQVERLDVFGYKGRTPAFRGFFEVMSASSNILYDVVTVQEPFWRGLLAWFATRTSGAKLNIQVHTDLSAQPFFRRLLATFLLQRADSIRVVSEKIRGQVQSMGVTVPIHVLPIYIDLQRFKNILPKPHAQKTILWIGRFEAEKDPQEAIQALQTVREQGIDARMVMLGTGSLEPVLRASARGLPVEFPGWEDPAEYFPGADVVLCTSRHESYGASIVEALAAGVLVVAPDVGVAREAGATVVAREHLSAAVCDVLTSGRRGELLLSMPGREEWAKQWRGTLV